MEAASQISRADVDSQATTLRSRRPGGNRPLSPEEYVSAVSAHAHLTIEASLYPGPSFDRLASFLKRSFVLQRSRPLPATEPPRFVFAHHYRDPSAPGRGRTEVRRAGDILQPDDVQRTSPGSLLFLRGMPSAEWLVNIGGTYRVDPEYFQRHLDFLATTGRINYYPPVSLPSSSDYIVQLRYMNIAKSGPLGAGGATLAGTAKLRSEAKTRMSAYLGGLALSMEKDKGTGNSIVRGLSFFVSGHLVIEQTISLCISRANDRWIALAWIDAGRDLKSGPAGPWSKYLSSSPHDLDQRAFLPTIQIRPWVALRSYQHRIPQDRRPTPEFAQSAALLHLDYGQTLDSDLMGKDAFYALHELFVFCASSQAQFLDMIADNISQDAERTLAPEELGLGQSNFMYIQEILEKQIAHIRDTIAVIEARGSASWPRTGDEAQLRMCACASGLLRKDYEWLLHRAESLSARCSSEINNLATRVILAESRKAIELSEEVAKLTRLAFIFVPLSFASSLFGMNLAPLVDERYSLWVWLAVSAPILILSWVFMQWDVVSVVREAARTKLANEGKI